MSKHSELVEAAIEFDKEIEAYRRAGELFVKTPLASVKHLERANSTLAEIAACEERLQAAAQRLVGVLGEARGLQENLAKTVVAHVPAVQAKNQQLADLMTEMAKLGGDVGQLNTQLAGSDPKQVSETVLVLSTRAEELAQAARAAELEEVAVQAHALHQRLLSVSKTLAKAPTPN